ncbi:MAG: type II toxin-antitoxin system RelE family toxin, partial [Chloroflexota bacterium]
PSAPGRSPSATKNSWRSSKPMARYELRFKPSVAKDLRGIPKADVQRILARIDTLRDDTRPPGAEKLSAQERYRLRQGDYRILYTVADAEGVVEIVKVVHRREVYRER